MVKLPSDLGYLDEIFLVSLFFCSVGHFFFIHFGAAAATASKYVDTILLFILYYENKCII